MEKMQGYEEAEALTGEYETIEPGGYICRIISAKEEKSSTDKKMLVIAFDIDEGEHKDYYKRRFDELKKNSTPDKPAKWPGVYRQMLEGEKAIGFLKGIMTSLEESNPNFKWNWDESKLKDLRFGGLFGREEYENQITGERKFSTKIRFIRTIKSIKEGKFEIPKDKLLEPRGDSFENVFNTTDDGGDGLPF